MATLKLKPRTAGQPATKAAHGGGARARPVRGTAAPRKRPTLAEAQAQRAAERGGGRARREPPDPHQPEPREPHEPRTPRHPREPRHEPHPPREPRPPERMPHEPPRGRGRSQRPPERAAHAPSRGPARSGEREAPPKEGVRLSKRLSELGLASRREADEWIERGWVRVDGRVVDTLGARVLPHQQVDVDAAAGREQAERVTVLLHKPLGYVSGQAEDDHEPAVVLVTADNRWPGDRAPRKFSPAHRRHLAPAGRLDIDSTGLLVLTQDGRVAKALIGDDSTIEKEYLVRVRCIDRALATQGAPKDVVPASAIERLRHGLVLDGVALQPAKVSWQNEQQLRVVLREGRKRQIRRMCELVGLHVTALHRVRIGRIALGALPPGQWRYLAPFERF